MARLHKSVYESLPAVYVVAGAALLWLSYSHGAAWWSNWCALGGVLALIAGLVIWMHRKDYRATSGDYLRRGRPVIEESRDEQR
jgi:hypothetical protein